LKISLLSLHLKDNNMKKTFWGFLVMVVAFASFIAWGLISASTHGPPAVGANSPWLAHLSSTETLAVICGVGLLGATSLVSAYQLLVGRSPHATATFLLFALLSTLNFIVSLVAALRALVPVPHFKTSRMCVG
jgi:hypothetical protein